MRIDVRINHGKWSFTFKATNVDEIHIIGTWNCKKNCLDKFLSQMIGERYINVDSYHRETIKLTIHKK